MNLLTREKYISFSIPIIQLSFAALAILTWLLAGIISPTELEQRGVAIYSIGTVVALGITLGIPFLLPNVYRDDSQNYNIFNSPWVPVITLAVVINTLVLVVSATLVLLSLHEGIQGPLVAMYASNVSLGMLHAQLARIHDNLPRMVFGVLPQLALPISVVLSAVAHVDLPSLIVSYTLIYATISAISLRSHLSLGRLKTLDAPFIRKALALVPHLFFFAALLQGPRMLNSLTGSDSLLASHYVMLVLNSVATGLASFNAKWASDVQKSSEDSLAETRQRILKQVAVICGGCTLFGVIALVALVSLGYLDSGSTHVYFLNVILFPVFLGTYYSGAMMILRSMRTYTFFVFSGIPLAILFALTTATSLNPWWAYPVALAVLASMPHLYLRSHFGNTSLMPAK